MAFCKVNALSIKRSVGLVRGKTDKIDAARIAAYGYEKKTNLLLIKILYQKTEHQVLERPT